ncbi:hypothetical protein Rsub_09644 [Raphidocelis subcapitata]|uniref:Protein arginine methyltransferase NDUFAF7 n=1 Tax=Raphidocelis subcapitata TaxID=307507 RepID=A0A2V0PAA4_9CHLO|nr:hypothetical protein Rsub_09644 [Raphidocelis subcapitata]|eukprot:GBF96788.1 hypothetical protein Rsub_09644 [Raphidocelis subcapitata]
MGLPAARRAAAALPRLLLPPHAAATAAPWRGLASAAGGGDGGMLMRDFIHNSLYHPELGYFNRATPPLARLPEPIQFGSLVGQAEYRLRLQQLYRELGVDWLTPAEVFRPWFGRSLAKFVLEERRHAWESSEPLLIVEIGGGTGTLAASVLDYIAEADPVLYSSTTYACLEISPRLSALQTQTAARASRHAGAFLSLRADASRAEAWGRLAAALPPQHAAGGHAFVVMTEVLDNLPHDKIVRGGSGGGNGDSGSGWRETWVRRPGGGAAEASGSGGGGGSGSGGGGSAAAPAEGAPPWVEELRPASDPLVARCMAAVLGPEAGGGGGGGGGGNASGRSWLQRVVDAALGSGGGPEAVWLPTRCLELLDALHAARPRHTLIAADFDALPDVALPGANAPLVSGRAAPGVARDYKTVLVPWGAADIFFPTDFEALGRLYAAAAASGGDGGGGGGSKGRADGGRVSYRHMPTAEFVQALGLSRHTQTLSGWNPLLQDWPNTRFFLGSRGLPDTARPARR